MKSDRKTLLLYTLMVAVLAQVYIDPAPGSAFVISAGVICMELLILAQSRLPLLPFIALSGIAAAALRTILVALSGGTYIQTLYSTLVFYGVFALLVRLSRFGQRPSKLLIQIGMLCVFDFISNFAELFVLRQLSVSSVRMILVTALARGILVWVMYTFYRRQTLYIIQEEHQKRYARLNQLAASIHSEAFYLSKAADDLSSLVKDSYEMYETADDPQISQTALALSRRSHEIRKDCTRVISGLQALTEDIEQEQALHLRDIFRIMQDSTVRQQEIVDKNLTVTFDCTGDTEIENYYDIFTILNNLISNSVDACGTNGRIDVRASVDDDMLTLTVSDDGCGIEEDVLPFIFGAGFSTKFDQKTGEASSGIGLCHVKNVTDLLGGTVEVTSDEITTFTVRIPIGQTGSRGQ